MEYDPKLLISAVALLAIAFLVLLIVYWRNVSKWRKNYEVEREKRLKAEVHIESSKQSLEFARQSLKDSFDAAAREALTNNNRSFIDLAEGRLNQVLKASEHELDKRSTAVEQMVKPLADALESQQRMVQHLGERSQQTFGNIHGFLAELKLSNEQLSRETQNLTGALKNPRIRGRWGEIGLKRAVEYAGLTSQVDFIEQTNTSTQDEIRRPDMIIKLPGQKCIAIDSKLPLDAYMQAAEADSPDQKMLFLKKHSTDFKNHVHQLGRKEYWKSLDNGIEFVILYVELEPAFSAAVEHNNDLIPYAVSHNIILATPTTLIALLKTIAQNWREHEAAENARKIYEAALSIHSRMRIFASHLQQVGKGLESATKSYNAATGSWDARLMPAFQKMEGLGVQIAGKPLKHPESQPVNISHLNVPDTPDAGFHGL